MISFRKDMLSWSHRYSREIQNDLLGAAAWLHPYDSQRNTTGHQHRRKEEIHLSHLPLRLRFTRSRIRLLVFNKSLTWLRVLEVVKKDLLRKFRQRNFTPIRKTRKNNTRLGVLRITIKREEEEKFFLSQ
jgi:hypothetical protein